MDVYVLVRGVGVSTKLDPSVVLCYAGSTSWGLCKQEG